MTLTQESDNVNNNHPLEADQNEDAKKINIIIPSMRDHDNDFLKNFDNFIDNNKNTIKKSNKVELLLDHIKHNLYNLSNRTRILRFKYTKYKKLYDKNNIAIIVISSILTLFSAITNLLQTEIDKSVGVHYIVGIIPIILGGTITLIAAIMKFKKLQEKMESISNLIEKSIMVMAKLKKTSEDLYLKPNDDDEFEKLESTFLTETCDICNNCIMLMEQLTKDSDYKKYLKEIRRTDNYISQIINNRKKDKVSESIQDKKSDFTLEELTNSRTMKEYQHVISSEEYKNVIYEVQKKKKKN